MKVLSDNTVGLSGKQIRFGAFGRPHVWMPKRLQPQAAGDNRTPELINDQ